MDLLPAVSRDMKAAEAVRQAADALNAAIQAALDLGFLVGVEVREDEVQDDSRCNTLKPPSVAVVVDKA
jgi:hypothetical protein